MDLSVSKIHWASFILVPVPPGNSKNPFVAWRINEPGDWTFHDAVRSQFGTFPDDRAHETSVRKFWNSAVDPAEGSVSLRLDTAGGIFAGSALPVKLETFVSGEFPVRNVGVPVSSGRTLSR